MSGTDAWAFIVNPISGNGYGAGCANIAKHMLWRHRTTGEVVLTQGKGHATKLAKDFLQRGFTRIVAVGGDGTLNEVARALVNAEGAAFGAVAAGTGNDLIHILGFPDRFTDEEWTALFEGNVAKMDVGRCNGAYFFNGMGLGFDAQVAYENYHMEDGGEVRKGKKSKYLRHIVKTIFRYREPYAVITMGGRSERRKCFLNSIGIGRRIAGGLFLTPKAFADDGMLDLCLTDPLSIPQRLGALVAVMKRRHLEKPTFHYMQAPSISFEFDSEVPAHLDGELIFSNRFQIDILPGALTAIYNPRGEHYFKGVGASAPS